MNSNSLIFLLFVLMLVCGLLLTLYDSYFYPKDVSLLEQDVSECYKPTLNKNEQKILVFIMDDADSRTVQNELVDNHVENVDVIEFMTDKQNAPQDWNTLASTLYKYYPQYDSFIVIHGQSNMGVKNMAAALSFMMENSKKPLVFAADSNLKQTLYYLYSFEIPEVVVFSFNRFVRATNPSHVIAKVGDTDDSIVLENRGKNVLQSVEDITEPLKVLYTKPGFKVVVLKAFPGLDSASFEELKKMDVIIVEDLQTLPNEDEVFKALKHLVEEEGIPVINTSPIVEKYFSQTVDEPDEDSSLVHCIGVDKDVLVVKTLILLSNVEKVDRQLLGKLLRLSMRGE